jgi:hypothetical protein
MVLSKELFIFILSENNCNLSFQIPKSQGFEFLSSILGKFFPLGSSLLPHCVFMNWTNFIDLFTEIETIRVSVSL